MKVGGFYMVPLVCTAQDGKEEVPPRNRMACRSAFEMNSPKALYMYAPNSRALLELRTSLLAPIKRICSMRSREFKRKSKKRCHMVEAVEIGNLLLFSLETRDSQD